MIAIDCTYSPLLRQRLPVYVVGLTEPWSLVFDQFVGYLPMLFQQ